MHSILSIFPLAGQALTLDNQCNTGAGSKEKTWPCAVSWPLRLECSGTQVDLQLQDPSYAATNSLSEVQDGHELLRWYLEKHSEEPFEVPKAASAAARLSLYGTTLAESLVASNILPGHGQHLYIEVISYPKEAEESGQLPGPDLNRLHWEVLEQVDLWPEACRYQSITVSRCILDCPAGHNIASIGTTQYPSFSSIASGEKGLNILLVVSRPKPTHDPDHQLVSRQLVAVLERLLTQSNDVKASVHILRPPTWLAFKEHLLVDHPFGHYDIVHLDMHGEIEDSPVEKPRAILKFCRQPRRQGPDPLRMMADPHTGDEVGTVLAKAGVRFVVLNACNSANAQLESPNTNLAKSLFKHNVSAVLAMSFKATEECVEIFMNTFYSRLLHGKVRCSYHRAAQDARLALQRSRTRRARAMQRVQLSDYIVPVLYQNQRMDVDIAKPPLPWIIENQMIISAFLGGLGQYIAPMVPSLSFFIEWGPPLIFYLIVCCYKILQWDSPVKSSPVAAPNLLGRDLDLLRIEAQLLALPTQKLLLLHGQGGCGKTAFWKYASRWWEATGWILGTAFLDIHELRKSGLSFDEICELYAKGLGLKSSDKPIAGQLLDFFRYNRWLVVFDHVECYSRELLDDSEKDGSLWRSFIQDVSTGQSMVIVCSRHAESSLTGPLSSEKTFRIGGLPIVAATELALSVATDPSSVAPDSLQASQQLDLITRIVILLDSNPSAIKMVFPILRQKKLSIQNLLNSLLFETVELDEAELCESRIVQTVREQWQHIEDLKQFNASDPAACFAPFWTIAPTDMEVFLYCFLRSKSTVPDSPDALWRDPTSRTWRERPLIGGVPLESMADMVMTISLYKAAGLFEEATIVREDGSEMASYKIHPILTLLARQKYVVHEDWGKLKNAYVSQSILWGHKTTTRKAGEHTHDAMTKFILQNSEQHMDHLNNMRILALAFSLDNSDLPAEMHCHGESVFEILCDSIGLPMRYMDRYSEFLAPLFERQLSRLHALIATRNNGPELGDLRAIFWPTDLLFSNTKDNPLLVLHHVNTLLSTYDAWKRAHNDAPFGDTEDFWFQMRYAEALLTGSTWNSAVSKTLCERNLRDDPQSDPHSWYVRSVHVDNVMKWIDCVSREYVANGVVLGDGNSTNDTSADDGKLAQQITANFKPGRMMDYMADQAAADPLTFQSLSLASIFAPIFEREKDVVARFGSVAHSVIFEPCQNSFSWLAPFMDSSLPAGTTDTVVPLEKMIQFMADQAKCSFQGPKLQAGNNWMEIAFRKQNSDAKGKKSLITRVLERGSLPEDSSVGWRATLVVHSELFEAAVINTKTPNFEQGLFHLDKMWELHHGVAVTAAVLLQQHLDRMLCFNGLGRATEAGKAVLKAIEQIPRVASELGDNSGLDAFTATSPPYLKIGKLRVLDVFIDGTDWSRIPGATTSFTLSEMGLLRKTVQGAADITAAMADMQMQMQAENGKKMNDELAEVLLTGMFKIIAGLSPYICDPTASKP